MAIHTRWAWTFLMPKALHPISLSLFGGVLVIFAIFAVQYPMEKQRWANEVRDIDAVGRMYESLGSTDHPVEMSTTQRPSEYLQIAVTTLLFKSPNAEAECITRLSDPTGPLKATATSQRALSSILNACRKLRFSIGRLGKLGTLISIIPLVRVNGELFGARVQVTTPTPAPSFLDSVTHPEDLQIISLVAALSMSLTFLLGWLTHTYLTALRASASMDGLTGCLRREAFFAIADREIRLHRKAGRPLTVLAIDVDHLKQINDNLGHAAGDTALNLIARALQSTLRKGDVLGRIGGDEFAVVLPTTDVNIAQIITERLRRAVEQIGVAGSDSVREIKYSVSIGLAEATQQESRIRRLLARADSNLYVAKMSRDSATGRGDAPLPIARNAR